MKRWLYYLLATTVGWLAFFALISTLPVLSGMFTWEQAFRMTLNHWFPWMLFSPLIAWQALRFPIEWTGWRWRVALHMFTGFLSVLACAWLTDFVESSWAQPFEHSRSAEEFGNRPPPFDNPPAEGPRRGRPSDMNRDGPPPKGPPPAEFHRRGAPLWARAGFNIPVYLAIVSLCHTFVYFRRSQQRDRRALELETQLGHARLQALRMQLQPHFLFNTLNAISILVQTNPRAAQEMIGSLGEMLRLSLDSGPDLEVPLKQELQFLDCYLEIAQSRFGGRLHVKRNIAPETSHALVPTFILQPLVENAIQHGIEPSPVPGTIELTVRISDAKLFISIRDTGVGLPAGNTARPATPNGIGIPNTKARLQSLYPNRHRFSVHNAPAGGCLAELEIPYHTEPAATGAKP